MAVAQEAVPALYIGPHQLASLRAAAEAAYPEECCGLLLGWPLAGADPAAYAVSHIVPATNRHPDPRRSFELDPATHVAVLRKLREQGSGGEALLGHYHSHPDAAAIPSPRDRAQANDPNLLWLIIAVAAGRSTAVTAWQPDLDEAGEIEFRPVDLLAGHTHAKNA